MGWAVSAATLAMSSPFGLGLFAVCLLLPLVFADDNPNEAAAKAVIEECRTKNNLEMDQIKDHFEHGKLPETEDGKCFMMCVLERAGVVEDNKFKPDKAKTINGMKLSDKPEVKEKADKVVDNCSKEVGQVEGKCEIALEIAKCYAKNAEQVGLKPKDIY